MTARTDLDNAISILDAGITAHVRALKSARDTAASAQAAANDDSHLVSLTSKVLAFADALSLSGPAVVVAVEPVAPVAAPLPEFLVPTSTEKLPAFPTPSALETMEAAVRSMVSGANQPT